MILFISHEGDGVALARRMKLEGQPVMLWIESAWSREKGHYTGLVPQVSSLEQAITMRPEVVFCDMVGHGEFLDKTFRPFIPVLGGTKMCDLLEEQRGWAIGVMHAAGVRIPETWDFNPTTPGLTVDASIQQSKPGSLHRVRGHLQEAMRVVQAIGGGWVIKPYFGKSSADTFVAKTPEEMLEHLQRCCEKNNPAPDKPFLLQRFIKGIELSTECYLQRGRFIPGSLTAMMEQKKFLVGDLGPATGAQTSVVWPYTTDTPKAFRETFGRPAFLRWLEHPVGPEGETLLPYTGPFELNSIISEADGLPYGLEWGPRMGFNSIYAWAELLQQPLGEVLVGIATGRIDRMAFRRAYGYTVQVSIPPFPASTCINAEKDFGFVYRKVLELGTGVAIDGPTTDPHVWLLDARQGADGKLETAGVDGIVANVSGVGASIKSARTPAHALVDAIDVEHKQARMMDGGDEAIEGTAKLPAWGYEVLS